MEYIKLSIYPILFHFNVYLEWISIAKVHIFQETTTIPKSDVILVSTIDGHLIALDAETGKQKWRFKEG